MKRSPLRKVSKKREKHYRAYLIMKPIFLKTHPYCEVPMCLNYSTSIHHRKGRTPHELMTDERFLMAICLRCHDKIHANPKWARTEGLLLI